MYTYTSITEKLKDEFDIEYKPGKKGKCPICGRETLGVSKDDKMAKCFHPNCGEFFSVYSKENQTYNKSAQLILSDIAYFLSYHLKHNKNSQSYKYLLSRGVSEKLIADSKDIGYIYDVDIPEMCTSKYLEPLLNLETISEKCQKEIDELEKLEKDLKEIFKHKEDWLVFFYRDDQGNIMQMHFRQPHTKIVRTFKLIEGGPNGVFMPVDPNTVKEMRFKDSELSTLNLVTEGEFNTLALQSLLAKCGHNYINCVSVGGASAPDTQTLRNMFGNNFTVAFDNDTAGKAMLEIIKKSGSFNAFTTPETDSDLDSYINFYGLKPQTYNNLLALVKGRKKLYKNYSDISKDVKNIRANKEKLLKFEVSERVANLISKELIDRGEFLFDQNNPYLFLKEEGKLIIIDQLNNDIKRLTVKCGINPSEGLFKYVVENLISFCLEAGKKVVAYRYAYYDREKFILYIHNGEKGVIKITKDKIDIIENGDDNILFVHDENFEPIDIEAVSLSDNLISKHLIQNVNFDVQSILNREDQAFLLESFILSMFFESLMFTKPLLVMIGQKGSGKTSILRRIGMLLFGSKYNVTSVPSKVDDLDTIVSNTYYCVLDNVDTFIEGLNDKLACYSTNQTSRKRSHYTNNDIYEITPKCFIAMSSRTPCFNRDDIADRIISLQLDRIKNFTAERKITDDLLLNRNKIISYIILRLQSVIKLLYMYKDIKTTVKIRMADFAEFILKTNSDTKKINKLFDKLTKVQSAFALQDDPLVNVLGTWLRSQNNQDKNISGNELFKELSTLALEIGIRDFTYKGARSMMKRLNNIKENINEYIIMQRTIARSNQSYYKFNITDKFYDIIDDETIDNDVDLLAD